MRVSCLGGMNPAAQTVACRTLGTECGTRRGRCHLGGRDALQSTAHSSAARDLSSLSCSQVWPWDYFRPMNYEHSVTHPLKARINSCHLPLGRNGRHGGPRVCRGHQLGGAWVPACQTRPPTWDWSKKYPGGAEPQVEQSQPPVRPTARQHGVWSRCGHSRSGPY